MAVELLEVLPEDLRPAPKLKKEKNAPCFANTKKDFLKKSGDSVTFQKGAIFCVAWLEKKGCKPVLIASTMTDPTRPPFTVSQKQNISAVNDVPCPQSVKEDNEKMGSR